MGALQPPINHTNPKSQSEQVLDLSLVIQQFSNQKSSSSDKLYLLLEVKIKYQIVAKILRSELCLIQNCFYNILSFMYHKEDLPNDRVIIYNLYIQKLSGKIKRWRFYGMFCSIVDLFEHLSILLGLFL